MKEGYELYNTLELLFGHDKWRDERHLQVFLFMLIGFLMTGSCSLPRTLPFLRGDALAQSKQRRLSRWLQNERIDARQLYGPAIQNALESWGKHTIYLAFDTSMLWNEYCLIRVSIVYRGRAIPLIWDVIEHRSSAVSFETYQSLLEAIPALLPPSIKKVVLLADRGFADTRLMELCRNLGWGFRIRIRGDFNLTIKNHGSCLVDEIEILPGKALFLQDSYITKHNYKVNLALGHHSHSQEMWYIATDGPADVLTFKEYGLRFDIEENFLDDKSNGFNVEKSEIRCAEALSRLFFVLASATLYLSSNGTQVVKSGERRIIDPHWFRGQSYLRIGWDWLRRALYHGLKLFNFIKIYGGDDPDPAAASVAQFEEQQHKFKFDCTYCKCP